MAFNVVRLNVVAVGKESVFKKECTNNNYSSSQTSGLARRFLKIVEPNFPHWQPHKKVRLIVAVKGVVDCSTIN